MASAGQIHAIDDPIIDFFKNKTSVRRSACDALARTIDRNVVPADVQGVCSYTVYVGPDLDLVVQFRLKPLELKKETFMLAQQVYGSLVPDTAYKTQLGYEIDFDGKAPLLVYFMDRAEGISLLEFIRAHGLPENSPENMARRENLVQDVAQFFALSWNSPQQVDQAYHNRLHQTFERELRLLLAALPDRFRPVVQTTLDSLPEILSLPMVLLHQDFSDGNIMVDETSCHLVGVIDWAEAEIGPFGSNLHFLQDLMSKLHPENGWIRYEDYDKLVVTFWKTLSEEVGGMTDQTIRAIKAARILGLLRSRGFTSRLADMPQAAPIKDDGGGQYNMMILDGLLLDPATKFD